MAMFAVRQSALWHEADWHCRYYTSHVHHNAGPSVGLVEFHDLVPLAESLGPGAFTVSPLASHHTGFGSGASSDPTRKPSWAEPPAPWIAKLVESSKTNELLERIATAIERSSRNNMEANDLAVAAHKESMAVLDRVVGHLARLGTSSSDLKARHERSLAVLERIAAAVEKPAPFHEADGSDALGLHGELLFSGYVAQTGGGLVSVNVARDLAEYPRDGTNVKVYAATPTPHKDGV